MGCRAAGAVGKHSSTVASMWHEGPKVANSAELPGDLSSPPWNRWLAGDRLCYLDRVEAAVYWASWCGLRDSCSASDLGDRQAYGSGVQLVGSTKHQKQTI